jgi:RNA polymerase sigma factor (sigma-70 family)
LLPPPCDEFTTSEPLRNATRVRPPGSTQVDWLRRNGREPLIESIEAWRDDAGAEEGADEALLQHLESSIGALESKEQELLKLAYFEAVPQRAIAERMESTPKAVETRLYRARKILRDLVARWKI